MVLKQLFRVSVLVVSVLLLQSPAHAQERKTLRVVFTGLAWNSELPFRVALARGFFKSQGLEILPIFVRGGPAALAALSSGEVEFAEIGGAQAIMRSRAGGLDVAIIGAISNSVAYQLVGSKSTRSLEDLKGKVVGVTGAGAFSDFATRTFLRRKGIDPDKNRRCAPSAAATYAWARWRRGWLPRRPLLPRTPCDSPGWGTR